jgi:steroid 5-alpha reductase family enzyme
MSSLVINITMDLQTDKVRKKKFTRYISSVYLSVNKTYHQQNKICNSIGMLVVAVIFAVIFFELSGIYQQSSFVGNPINNGGICSNSFPTLWNISKELCRR